MMVQVRGSLVTDYVRNQTKNTSHPATEKMSDTGMTGTYGATSTTLDVNLVIYRETYFDDS